MSRWTIALASLAAISFSRPAIAADDNLPRNIELKQGAAPADEAAGQTAEDASSGTTTRQIVTEGKDAPPADAPKDVGARPAPHPRTDRLPAHQPDKQPETAVPPKPQSRGVPPPPGTQAGRGRHCRRSLSVLHPAD